MHVEHAVPGVYIPHPVPFGFQVCPQQADGIHLTVPVFINEQKINVFDD
jgi:hypothetical protein